MERERILVQGKLIKNLVGTEQSQLGDEVHQPNQNR